MALRTSLVLSGDSAGAEAALKETAKGLEQASAEARRLSAAYDATDKAIDRVARAQAEAKQETAATKAAFAAGEISLRDYNARLLETKTALSLIETEHRNAVNALKQAQGALGGATVSAGQAQAGYINLGRQIQDVTVQLQGGANIGTIIAQQGGQVADAVAQMGGRFAGFAQFMAGPVGSVIIVVAGMLANALIPALMGAGDEAEKSAKKAMLLHDALLKVADGNEAALESLRAYNDEQARARAGTDSMIKLDLAAADAAYRAAIAKREQLRAILDTERAANLPGAVPGYAGMGGPGNPASAAAAAALERNDTALGDLQQARRNLRIRDAVRDAAAAADPLKAINNRYDDMAEAAKRAAAGNDALSRSLKGTLTAIELRRKAEVDAERESERKPKKDRSAERARKAAEQAEDFGLNAGRRIEAITQQFGDLPTAVTKANGALRDLDALSQEIFRKNPPNLQALLADIASARDVIQSNLNKPFADYLEQARGAEQIDRLLIAGKRDEAQALQIVLAKEKQMGPLSEQQLDSVLATVRAERERSLVLRDQQAIIQGQVRAVQDMRGALEQTVANALRGRFSLSAILDSLGNSFVNLASQKIVQSVFGDTLRQLEDQASGVGKVDAAGTQMAAALDKGADAVGSFAEEVAKARDAIAGSGGSDARSLTAAVADATGSALNNVLGTVNRALSGKPATGAPPEATGDEIVVNAPKGKPVDVSTASNLLLDMVGKLTRDLGINLPKAVTLGLKGPIGKLEQAIPAAITGAFTGQAASKLILGSGGSSIGASIGGAIGQKMGEKFLSKGLGEIGKSLGGLGSLAGPIGSIVGGLLGGALGGLFSSKPKGASTVTASSASSWSNNSQIAAQLDSMGSSLQSAVAKLADQFGTTVGQYEVGLGRYKDYYQVASTADPLLGSPEYNKKSSKAIYDGTDPQAALAAAVKNAIEDGALKGISAAVKKALTSSNDIDQAIREAVKVQDVELALGGLGAQLEKSFRQFELQAQERLRIATKYGFDVVAMEKRNAEDRLKLQKDLLDKQVGSLQSLIDQMTSGSLFEGSAIDQRTAILAEIAKTKVEADKGTEGAADKLAQLLEQLNSVSKEAYGTTGGFAADRSLILDQARDTIAKANQRVTDAQKAAAAATAETNAALSENNDQNAAMLRALGLSNELLAKIAASGSRGSLASLVAAARTS